VVAPVTASISAGVKLLKFQTSAAEANDRHITAHAITNILVFILFLFFVEMIIVPIENFSSLQRVRAMQKVRT